MQKRGILDKKSGNLNAIRKKVELRIPQEYKKLLKKRIIFKKINEKAVSKHFLGLSKAKKISLRQEKKIAKYSKGLKRVYSLNCTANYMQFFLEKK